MFGVIISSRPVLTSPQQVSETQFAFAIPSAPSFSHIVIFLLPGVQLPPDTAAAVYVQLPGRTEFKLLGAIANEKQSAIFKVNNKAIGIDGTGMGVNDDDAMVDDYGAASAHIGSAGADVMLGISIEPAVQVANGLAQMKATSSTPSSGTELVRRNQQAAGGSALTTKVLAQRIIKNAFDYLASFAGSGPGGSEVVPLKSFQDWWTKFEKRIENDPGFLERSEQG